jgi:hypothetical protein
VAQWAAAREIPGLQASRGGEARFHCHGNLPGVDPRDIDERQHAGAFFIGTRRLPGGRQRGGGENRDGEQAAERYLAPKGGWTAPKGGWLSLRFCRKSVAQESTERHGRIVVLV